MVSWVDMKEVVQKEDYSSITTNLGILLEEYSMDIIGKENFSMSKVLIFIYTKGWFIGDYCPGYGYGLPPYWGFELIWFGYPFI